MDLVSCRNLLIYMDADLQAVVIPSFHYALAPGGMLLLGSSETVTQHDGLFATLDKENRIFQRRDGPSAPIRVPPRFVPNGSARASALQLSETMQPEARTSWTKALAVANGRVLERFAAPFVVVTEDGTVVHYSSHVGSFLQAALGPPSRSLFDMVRHSLRHSLRAALHGVVETGRGGAQRPG